MEKILIIGNYGDGNIGDESILDGLLDELYSEGVSPHNIIIPSRNPCKLHELHKNHIKPIAMKSIFKEYYSIDTIIFGGGTIFSRYSGVYLKLAPIFIIISKVFFKKKNILFSGIGISNNISYFFKKQIQLCIRFVDEISVRDMESFKIFTQSMKFKNKITLITDYGSRINPVGLDRVNFILSNESIPQDICLIGISLNYVYNEEINNKIETTFSEIINWLLDTFNIHILYFTFAPEFVSSKGDKMLRDNILIKPENQNKITLLDYYSPNETLGLVGAMDFFIGMRFHSQVFAYKSKVPLIGVIYDDKCSRFLNENSLKGMDIAEIIRDTNKFKVMLQNEIANFVY